MDVSNKYKSYYLEELVPMIELTTLNEISEAIIGMYSVDTRRGSDYIKFFSQVEGIMNLRGSIMERLEKGNEDATNDV